MALELVRLRADDYIEAIDFMNLVFSQNGRPHNFEKMLPKMCLPDEAHMNMHFAMKRDGRIRGMLGVYPLPARIAGRDFLFSTVGNVCTHINERGNGLMQALMKEAMAELDRLGADASRLGGLRSRYNRYGYEKAGTLWHLRLTERNLKDEFGSKPPIMHFVPIAAEDRMELERAMRLHDRTPFHVIRGSVQDFYLTCKAWKSTPYAAYTEQGKYVGYLTADESGAAIVESAAEDPAEEQKMICAWLGWRGVPSISMSLMPLQNNLLQYFGRIAEDIGSGTANSYFIRNWVGITDAFMQLRASQTFLPEGRIVLEVKGYGGLDIRANGNIGSCTRTDDKPDITLDPLTATRFIFGPMPALTVADVPGDIALQASAWFPLPLSWNTQDRV